MQSIKSLTIGAKLVLVAAIAFFLNLSLTWQKIEIDFGPAGTAEQLLDGWDAWGLLLGVLSIAIVVLTVLVHLTDVELPEHVRWDRIALALGIALLAITVVKNLLDDGSTIASYVGIGLAALVAGGTLLDVRRESAAGSSAARA
ncbi:MAG: hypothetical protein KatS3mg012_1996 [Gaiellaceae bacterium]|jgi:hypothetical protein|nr:MAG: hypothetical protein KatS3mg012_1996 [Gaiellaceae bacterium]